MNDTIDQQALDRAMDKVRQAAEKFGPLGRPADSFCICREWMCPCQCHKRETKGDVKTTENAMPAAVACGSGRDGQVDQKAQPRVESEERDTAGWFVR